MKLYNFIFLVLLIVGGCLVYSGRDNISNCFCDNRHQPTITYETVSRDIWEDEYENSGGEIDLPVFFALGLGKSDFVRAHWRVELDNELGILKRQIKYTETFLEQINTAYRDKQQFPTLKISDGPFSIESCSRTALGWVRKYDSEGRPLNADPNTTTTVYLDHSDNQKYTIKEEEWIKEYYVGEVDFNDDKEEKPFYVRDSRPDYLPSDITSIKFTEGTNKHMWSNNFSSWATESSASQGE